MNNNSELRNNIDINIYRKELPNNFFAFGVYLKDGVAKHAVILIRVDDIDYMCHFPGNRKPELITINENTISKSFDSLVYHITNIIDYSDPSMLYSTLAVLQRICMHSDMKYSFIHDGSTYRIEDGAFNSKHGLPEFGSCVGFCLNAINTLISSSLPVDGYFVKLEDWPIFEADEYTIEIDNWARDGAIKNFPQLDKKSYETYHKRITPLEFLCMSYIGINQVPISKLDLKFLLDILNVRLSELKQAV